MWHRAIDGLRRGGWRAGLALWLLLLLPPVRALLEASMARQMLLQVPLLALAGAWLWRAWPYPPGTWNRQGVSGLLLASFTGMLWMLPRAMDAALALPAVEAAKFVSVPLLLGAALAASWPRAGFVVRGVFILEVTATLVRVGWLYLAAPTQLCANYLIGDQQQVGRLLVGAGLTIWLLVVYQLVFGRVWGARDA